MWRVDGVMAAMGLSIAGLLLMVRILGRRNLKNLRLEYRGPTRIEAGKGFHCHLKLINPRAFFDAFWVEFGVRPNGEKEFSGRVLWLEGNGTAELSARLSLTQRGKESIQKAWLKSGFPLGLMSFSRGIELPAEIGVWARQKTPHELHLNGFLLDGPPLGGSRQFGGRGDWRGLREWRGGDSVRRIVWAASRRSQAGGGGLLVREDEPPGSHAEECLVIFHSFGGDGNLIRPDRFENAISLLSGTLRLLQASGMAVRWKADFTGWSEREIRTRRQLAESREELLMARRASWTEAHDLLGALAGSRDRECVILISDMPLSAWKNLLPTKVLKPVLIDISRYDRARKSSPRNSRQMLGQKGGGK
ncbi:DUF58 domain-containing protein [Luteolibacter algae]|uniref:DUF58 domain-containing protein n=2 Tax=Luteolibacter algae TaxID=454151 RepID=A0ABW5D5Q1_9BACT